MLAHLKGIVVHLIIMAVCIVGGFYYLFYVYLPATTNHGETITIPNLEGMNIKEVKNKLESNSLQYQIIDSTTYNPRFEPSVVMNQVPPMNSKVKENRKVYLTVNAKEVPQQPIPDLSNKSLRNAIITLETYGFIKGEVVYKPYNSPVVMGMNYNGKEIEAGDSLPRGSAISLIIGLTDGNSEITVPDLIGREFEGLKKYLDSYGLILSTRWVEDDEMPENVVFKQSPMPSDSTSVKLKTVKAGAIIDVWVSGTAPVDTIK